MAWGKNRHGASSASGASSGPRAPSSGGRGGRRRPPGEPTEQDIARSIQQSAVRVRVTLQLGAVQGEAKTLQDVLTEFEQSFEARRGSAVTGARNVRLELLECGLNSWQNLVELQRVLSGLERPKDNDQEQLLLAKTKLRHDVKYDEWTLTLGFNRPSEDALWTFASSLMLRLKSCRVLSKVLLPNHRLALSLASAFSEWGDNKIGEYQWEGRHEWSQVVVDVVAEQKEEIQRVHLTPARDLSSSNRSPLADLRYPELVSVVDGMLSGNVDARKPVVVILRGIPGSGKSTLGREIATVCRHRGVAFTACSADFFFETPRGYVFDVKKLGTAHSKCKGDFTRAVQGDIPRDHDGGKYRRPHGHLILVDNTSTQLWEYEPYEDIAKSNGCRVHIIEMKCSDALTAFRMGQRNSHGVPPDKVVSMFMRWEEDSRARCFTPQFEHAALTANPLSDGEVGGLIYLGLFLNEGSQQRMLAQIPTVHPNKVADHVTLFYRPNKQYARDAELGASFIVRGVEVVTDELGQTLRVELDERLSLQVRNKTPHITMSTKDGVSASYSNDLLENEAATRTSIDPPIEFTAHVGVALLVQNQRMITTTSPFAADFNYCLTSKVAPSELDNSHESIGNSVPPNANAAANAKLFILHVKESDIMDDAEEAVARILSRAKIVHMMGAQCTTHRALCIQRSQASSSSSVQELLKKVQDHYLLPSTYHFDDVAVISHSDSFQGFKDAFNKYLSVACLRATSHLTMLTTVVGSMQWPLREMNNFQDAALSVSYIGYHGNAVRFDARLQSPCSTISSVLDLLGINIQEQARRIAFCGMNVVNDAWAHVLATEVNTDVDALGRIDTTLAGLSSSLIELCLVLPSGTMLSELHTLQGKLVRVLEAVSSVRDVVGSCTTGKLYFSLCAASSCTPVFCVQMAVQSKGIDSGVNLHALAQLKFCKQQARASRDICDVESYSVLTALLRAVILRRGSSLPPSKCSTSSLTNLVSERLVLQYLRSTEVFDGAAPMPTAEDVASGLIVSAFYRMLTYFSKLSPDEWAAAFGNSLLAFQGSKNSQTVWSQVMENEMQNCKTVLSSHGCVGDHPTKATPLNPEDHLRVLLSLIVEDVPVAVGASCDRAYFAICGRSKWSQAHSLAFCDKLRHAAAMLLPQDDDERNGDNGVFFSCSPSFVARRIDVITSSLELLRHVMEKLELLEADVHDSDGALSGDYTIRRAETDDEVLADLNRPN